MDTKDLTECWLYDDLMYLRLQLSKAKQQQEAKYIDGVIVHAESRSTYTKDNVQRMLPEPILQQRKP